MQLLSAAKFSLPAMSRRVSPPDDSPEPSDHFEIVSIDEGATALKSRQPRNLAVLTFDDGYYDFFHNAFPELASRSLPATVYLPTFHTDSGSRFPWDARFADFQSVRPMRWEEVESVARTDRITIGSHTHTHRRLDCIRLHELEQEIRTCEECS